VRLRVGLTGGIGAGKSEVAKFFTAFGALVIDADLLARTALAPGSAGLARVRALWPSVVSEANLLDRAALAGIVFRDPAALDALNGIVHPFVRARSAELEASSAPGQIVVHDVPLLFEAGFYRACDANVVVVAETETRLARVVARTALDAPEIRRRMLAQIDPERACELADYTLRNDGTLEQLRASTREVYDDLLERRPRSKVM